MKEDLVWRTFHRLTVIWLENSNRRGRWWRCKCKCWKEVVRSTSHLNENVKHSCGCRWWQYHHQSYTHFYNKYREAKKRCNNPNVDSYKYYWWKWIKFEWNSFNEFKNDMYDSYLEHVDKFWEKNTSLDRIDWNWNYCKENCRWATRVEQNLNRSNMEWVEYMWERMSIAQLCKKLWFAKHRVEYLKRKWLSIDEIVRKLSS